MTHYTVDRAAPSSAPELWRHVGDNDPNPHPVLARTVNAPEVFRAAAAVLAPDDEVRELVAGAVFAAEGTDGEYYYTLADAVLAALKQHATGGDV
jgi:hypothetical protein